MLLFALVMLYPILTVICMTLVIPLFVYVNDYAPFQSLKIWRPLDFITLVTRVYRAWMGAHDGKLKPKDL